MCEKIKIKLSRDQIIWFYKTISEFNFDSIESINKIDLVILQALIKKVHKKIGNSLYSMRSDKLNSITFDIELFAALYKIMLVVYDFCEIYEQLLIREQIFNNIQPKLV